MSTFLDVWEKVYHSEMKGHFLSLLHYAWRHRKVGQKKPVTIAANVKSVSTLKHTVTVPFWVFKI